MHRIGDFTMLLAINGCPVPAAFSIATQDGYRETSHSRASIKHAIFDALLSSQDELIA
jgi:hypothetical protein